MRNTSHFLAGAAVLVSCILSGQSCCGTAQAGGYEFASLYEGLPFEMPRVERPVIPDRTVSLADFGAIPDGTTRNTEAFAAAIRALSDKGGGHLVVPAGLWNTGPITLLSNIDLHLEKNAIINFDPDTDLYPVIDINFEGLDTRRCLSPLNCKGQKNVSITGEGIIEGNGIAWRELSPGSTPPRVFSRLSRRPGIIDKESGKWYPSEGYIKGRKASGNLNVPDFKLDPAVEEDIKPFLRPVMISFIDCENVLLEGCTFQHSPCWNIHPLWCRNVIVKDITVRTEDYAANGDGIDIDGCENVIVTNSSFDVGDDGVCIKSGKDADGRRHAKPCRNLIIDGCTVYHAHGGFTVGSEMSGGVENIKVSNCSYLGTDVGLRFKSRRGRGGVVRNIWVDHIYMKDIIDNAFVFNLYYMNTSAADARKLGLEGGKKDMQPVDETTPRFEDMHFSDITVSGAARSILMNGLPEMHVKNIDFKDCVIRSVNDIEINYSSGIRFDNVKLIPEKPGQVITDCDNLVNIP